MEDRLSRVRGGGEGDVQVSVEEGQVSLRGVVDAVWKRVRAEKTVRTIEGVKGVINDLAVVPSESLTDEFIARGILEAMERNLTVNAAEVEVTVLNRGVILEGSVPSVPTRSAAHTLALCSPGVTEVENRLVPRSLE